MPSGKIKKYEHLTGEETLLSNQSRIIEQAKCTYSLLGKTIGKQIKTRSRRKTNKALEDLRKQLVKSNALAEKEIIPFDRKEEKKRKPLDKEKGLFLEKK